MSNIVPVDFSSTSVALPQNTASLFENTIGGVSAPHLSIRGKVFTVIKDGHEQIVADEEGNPLPNIKVVVLGHTPGRTRTYFANAYEPGKNVKPTCHSYDGIRPSSDSEEPQSESCDNCPLAVKGSKMSGNGKPISACAQGKRLAVVPSDKIDDEPYLLKLPITSIWQETDIYAEKGWFAWDSYCKFIKRYGVNNPAAIETTMRFDPKSEHPQLLFKYSGNYDEPSLIKLAERSKSSEIKAILGLDKGYADHVGKRETVNEGEKPAVQTAAADDLDDIPPQKTVKADDLDDAPAPTAKSKKTAAKKSEVKVVEEGSLDDVLANWD